MIERLNKVGQFIGNGGGAITFRLLATALSSLIIVLLGYEGERMNSRLDELLQASATQASVQAVQMQRLDDLSQNVSSLWASERSQDGMLANHEHRLTYLEARQRGH